MTFASCAVAFRLYDIGHTGAIERSELKRFLIALMADNPDIDLDEKALDEIVDEVWAGVAGTGGLAGGWAGGRGVGRPAVLALHIGACAAGD